MKSRYFLGKLLFSYGFPGKITIFYGFPVVFPWFSYGFPMVSLFFPYGFPMVSISLRRGPSFMVDLQALSHIMVELGIAIDGGKDGFVFWVVFFSCLLSRRRLGAYGCFRTLDRKKE